MQTIITNNRPFNADELVFSDDVYTTPHGCKLVNFFYKERRGMVLQTGPMKTTAGIKVFGNNTENITLLLNFEDRMDSFIHIFNSIDDAIMDNIIPNSGKWFNKQLTCTKKDLISMDKYVSMIKETDGYNPSIRPKLKFKDGRPTFTIFNEDRERIQCNTLEDLQSLIVKGSRIQVLLQSSSIWNSSNRIGVSWNILQIMLLKSSDMSENMDLEECLFLDDGTPSSI
ncbi:hypothetical protein [Heterosigma akashiwo virus 01]|jgi:hypothetical protein|uniref:Uncharacterized protein n=1 Tax=Heterosigma akashiwo virus 01 TaxID=97195 RepID=A0A1C9C517_HAV01|nr:hypothetical protein D1R72_gp048 [Heterosigma akashiwo virus 01]AOM63379.1 hypothetical protein [Heterosigma akashiwo virus 01]